MSFEAPRLVSTKEDDEGSNSNTKGCPQLLLPTIYGLNKSFGKKVYLGLECANSGLLDVVVRLTGPDFNGLSFNLDSWRNFVAGFEYIAKFFKSSRDNRSMLDQKVIGCGFSVHFTIAHRDKAIEIELHNDENEGKFTGREPKLMRRHGSNIVMKKTTFEILQNIVPTIEARLRYLKKALPSYNEVLLDLNRASEEKFVQTGIRTHFEGGPFLVDPEYKEEDFKKIKDLLQEKGLFELSADEIGILYNELLYLSFDSQNFCIAVPE